MTTDKPDLDALARRLERLESQNRRLKTGVVVALLLVGFMVLAQQTPASRAQQNAGEKERLALRDKDGVERAWLGMGDDGPGLFLHNPGQKSRAEITMGQGGLLLRLAGEDGKGGAGISVQPNGIAIAAQGPEGKPAIGVNALRTDAGVIFGDPGKPADRRP